MDLITLDGRSGSGRYADIFDVCEALVAGKKCSSPPYALAFLARQSALYRQTKAKIDATEGQVEPAECRLVPASHMRNPTTSTNTSAGRPTLNDELPV